jgi:F0F1-type ATP synthase assembly protein I
MDRDDRRSGERDQQVGASAERRAAGPTTGGDAGGMGGLAFAGLGLQFAASLVVFAYLGQWLDRRLGTAPVFLLVSVLVGSGAAFYAMYRQLMRAQRREDAARAAAREGARPGAVGPAPERPASGPAVPRRPEREP